MNLYGSMDHSPFKKLSIAVDTNFKILDKQIEFELDSTGRKIQYFDVASQSADAFIASMGEYSKHFYTSFVDVATAVPPHTDIVDKVNINFYIETGNYTTTFYTSQDGSKRLTYADHGDGHVYNLDDLTPTDSFVAQPGDVYMLNGKVIHGVDSTDRLPRKFIQVSTNVLDYEQVVDILAHLC
jgi:hypothetical protein